MFFQHKLYYFEYITSLPVGGKIKGAQVEPVVRELCCFW